MLHLSFGACLCRADQGPSWRARITEDTEPGERLVIRGHVLRSRSGGAAAGVTIMVYQTDAAGIYSRNQGHPRNTARLRGQFTTGPNGEYEIVTIRPGAYPGGGVPAHIHVNLMEAGKEPRELFEFLFAGDPSLKGNENAYVLRPRKDASGTWIAEQDIALVR